MRFKLKDSNLFPLPGNPHMLHLGTITSGLREFIVMTCVAGEARGNCYIEEVVLQATDWQKDVYAHCKFIQDDVLAMNLRSFCETNKVTDMKKVTELLIATGRGQWLNPGNVSKSSLLV